jgi:hypothetical protein
MISSRVAPPPSAATRRAAKSGLPSVKTLAAEEGSTTPIAGLALEPFRRGLAIGHR